jgi:L-ascorbate metabolism protein UlaG (beta-lactamase superfamily)
MTEIHAATPDRVPVPCEATAGQNAAVYEAAAGAGHRPRPACLRRRQLPESSDVAPDTVTWWGHATVAMHVAGVRLVTDPVLRPAVAFLRWAHEPPPRGLAQRTDIVLVSHPHRDHLDLPSLAMFTPGTQFLVPVGSGPLVRRVARGPVTELAVGDTATVDGVQVRATHAEHDGRRSAGWTPERTAGPALGFVVSAGSTIYFAGDTDLFAGMADVDPRLDLALLPVSGWGLTLAAGHLNPLRAAQALRMLGARRAIPIHWGSLRIPVLWRLDPSRFTAPGSDFEAHARELAPEVDAFVAARGQAIEVTGGGRCRQ